MDNILNCQTKSLPSFWSQFHVKPKYVISSVYLVVHNLYNQGLENLYDLGLNTIQYELKKLKEKSFLTQKVITYINQFLQSCRTRGH